jgi:alpha-L-rhamnosidase
MHGAEVPPYVLGFRLKLDQPEDAHIRLYVTADERYELYLDGKLISRGPERCSPEAWYYTTLEVDVCAGRHLLFARVWALGDAAPCAQMSERPGFLLGAENPDGTANRAWSTGLAQWQVRRLDGYGWTKEIPRSLAGRRLRIDGRVYPWGVETSADEDWLPAEINSHALTTCNSDLEPNRVLVPGTLPRMLTQPVVSAARFLEDVPIGEDATKRPVRLRDHRPDLAKEAQDWVQGHSALRVPANHRYRMILDLGNYVCAYTRFEVSQGGGGQVTTRWAEALFEEGAGGRTKGNRNELENRVVEGVPNVFKLDGQPNRDYSTLWWEAGRYLEIVAEAGNEDIILHRLILEETRYPLEMKSSFSANEPRLNSIVPLLLRTLQVNAHETFMDCPHYEQLNYVGDTLIDCLNVYTLSRDVRLVQKSIQLFHDSVLPTGLTQSRYPSRERQVIPPFSLLWCAMVRNHAWWRGDAELVRAVLPAVRRVIDTHLLHVNSAGLLAGLPGWNFLDWGETWTDGIPPGGDSGEVSAPLNWLFVYTLQAAAELEAYVGEPEQRSRYHRLAQAQARAIEAVFWNDDRGLFADDAGHRFFSEHAQCLALLSGHLGEHLAARTASGLLQAQSLQRCTIYFSHYLFETYRKIGKIEPLFERLQYWLDLPGQGFFTAPERPEPSRSDCHAWGSHPLHHFFATILGIRPAAMGFEEIDIQPQLGALEHVKGRMVHPRGWIEVDLRKSGDRLKGTVTIPIGVKGTFRGGAGCRPLASGTQVV